jgi:hypothetical protein
MTSVHDCPLVLMEWLDSSQPVSGWRYLKDAPSEPAERCASVRWLLRDEHVKELCQTIGDTNDDNPQGMGMVQIPACAVISVSILAEKSSARA